MDNVSERSDPVHFRPNRWVIPAMILSGAALFLYIVLRARYVSFTHDEALTFFEYVNQPWKVVSNVNYTNNHLLNSWCMRFCLDAFGPSQLSLRFPNVFCGLLYIVFSGLLARKLFGKTGTAFFAFIIFCSNQFLIEFFSLGRGYGISMGLLMGACWFLLLYFSAEKPVKRIAGFSLSLLFTVLATLANYTIISFLLLHLVLLLGFELRRFFKDKSRRTLKKAAGILPALAVVAGVAWYLSWFIGLMLKLRAAGNFDFGGKDGLWSDTVASIVTLDFHAEWLYFYEFFRDTFTPLATALTAIVLLTTVFFAVVRLRNSSGAQQQLILYAGFALLACGTGIWLQHQLLGTLFSVDRAAMYLIPLFVIFTAGTLLSPGKWQKTRRVVAALFFIHPVFSVLISLNLNHTTMWPENSNAEAAVNAILHDAAGDHCPAATVNAGVSYLNFPVYNYYLFVNKKMSGFSRLCFDESNMHPGQDYFFGSEDPGADYREIWTDHRNSVWKRKKCLCDHVISSSVPVDPNFKLLPGGEKYWEVGHDHNYAGRISDTIRDTIQNGAWVYLSGQLYTSHFPVHGAVTLEITRRDSFIVFHSLQAGTFLFTAGRWTSFVHYSCPGAVLVPGDVVNATIFGDDDCGMRVKDFSLSMIRRLPCDDNK